MRNFEERIAEIRRRSEVIQAMRKKRKKQILAVSIPLVLCTAIAMPLLLPNTHAKISGNAESVALQEDFSDQKNSISESVSVTTKFTAIEVTNLSHSQVFTNQAQIAAISNVVYSTIENSESNATQPDEEGAPPTDNTEISEISELWIYMYIDEEIKESYLLSGACMLVDNKTGKTYQLTTGDAESLTTLLSAH